MRDFKLKKPCSAGSKKSKIIIGILLAIIIMLGIVYILHGMKGEDVVEFRVLTEAEVPQDMTGQVIPEYRQLERALACVIDDKIYVLVTRGEKPTGGYGLVIKEMVLEEDDGSHNLIVKTKFKDPEPGTALSQVLTYPLQVAETALTELPDTIELRVEY